MLQIQDLASRRNGQPFLNGVTLAIPDGQTVLLTGRADCGKSALLRIVGGLEKYSRGTIRFDDLPTHADQLRRIAYFTAKGTLPPFLSADGVAELASLFWTNFDAEGYTYRLRKMDIPQRQPLSRLTAYERSCIELACGMARGCVYLLLDSTFSADVRTASLALQSVLSSFPDRHLTVLIASPLWKDWSAHVGRAIWLTDGRVSADICTQALSGGQTLTEALGQAVHKAEDPPAGPAE